VQQNKRHLKTNETSAKSIFLKLLFLPFFSFLILLFILLNNVPATTQGAFPAWPETSNARSRKEGKTQSLEFSIQTARRQGH
jgi:hypothetical protein